MWWYSYICAKDGLAACLRWHSDTVRAVFIQCQWLDRDVRLGAALIGESVTIGEPSHGTPWRTINFQSLNLHATRETHHTQPPFHQARSVPQGKKKTVFDAWNRYHSVPLNPDDWHYTTFFTPSGRYRYRTASRGYIALGDGYTRTLDGMMKSLLPYQTKQNV